MATTYSELELALDSLVTEFHSAADNNSCTLTSAQFQTLISQQLPSVAKAADGEDGVSKLLQEIGVANGQDISFENFWTLIQQLATDQFNMRSKERSVRCGCLLQ
ncbi:S100 calcium binding protein V1 [Polymixia lowei]